MKSGDLYTYQRNLPHWRLDGAVYFVTWRLIRTQSPLLPPEKDLIETAVRFFDGKRYELLAFVVMDDHVHVLLMPLGDVRIESLVHSWKSFTAHEMQKKYGRVTPVWQAEYFDRIVRDEAEYLEKANYILNNPRKRWPEIEDYRWVGLGVSSEERR